MGQGVTTGLTTLVAEDLDVAPLRFIVELAGPHEDYGNPDFGGMQGTGGSTSVKAHYLQLRQVGADVRRMILLAAAKQLQVPVSALTTADAHVIHDGVGYPYGEFVNSAKDIQLETPTPLKPISEFNYIGKVFPRLDGVAKATGTAEFGIDVDVPGMHHAVPVHFR